MSTDNLNKTAVTLGEAIGKTFQIEAGVIKFEGDLLEHAGALPEGVDADTYKKVQKQAGINAQAIEYAAGTTGVEYFANGGEGEKVTGKIKVGSQSYNVSVQREKPVDTSAPGSTEPKWETRHGVVTGGYETKASAEHKRLRESLFQAAGKRLAK